MTKSEYIDFNFLIKECKQFARVSRKNKTVSLTQKQFRKLTMGKLFYVHSLAERGMKLIMQD